MTIPRRQKTACIHTLSAALSYACFRRAPHKPSCLGLTTDPGDGMIISQTPRYRSWGWDDYKPYRQRRRRAHKGYELEQKAKPQEVAKVQLQIIVSIADQRISVYDDGTLIARSSVSTGVQGHPTPVGVFSVIGKELWHRSNIYSAAPCPTCSGSPGRVSRSMPGFYPGIRHHMAAFAWQRTSPFDSGISRSGALA